MHALTVIGYRKNILRTSVHIVWMSFFYLHILNKESIIKQKLEKTNKCAKQGGLLAYVYAFALFAVRECISKVLNLGIY